MAADGSVIIQIDGDDSGFEKTLNGLKGIASGAVKGIAAGMAAATAGVAALSKAALDSYASYEQLVGGVDTLFKESSATVQQYAAEAYKTAGVSANTYMEQATAFSASLIQALGGDTQAAAQYANQAIMDMSDNANKMGTDIESIQQTYQSLMRGNYAMLDNLKLGYGGTKKELERLVSDAEKLTGQALDPSKFSDIITAIHAVQENLGITGTTALEASTTIEGSLNMAKAAWSNLLTGIADDNADFSGLVDNFVTSVETAASNILPRLETIFSGIGQLVAGLAPVIAQAIPSLITNVLPGLATAAASMLTAFGSALMQNLPLLMSSATSLVTGFLTYIQTNLPLLLTSAGQIIQTLGTGIMTALPQLATSAASIIQTLWNALTTAAPQLLSVAVSIMQNIATGIASNLPSIIPAALSILTQISSGLRSGAGQLIDGALAIIQAIGSGIIQSIPELIESVPQIVTNIADIINDNAPKLLETAASLIGQLASGLVQAIPTLVSNIPQIIEAIVSVFLAFNWLDIGKTIITMLKNGITSMIGAVQSAAGNVLNAINSTLQSLPSTLLNLGKQGIQGLISGVQSLIGAVGSAMTSIANAILNGVRSLPGQLLSIGSQIIQGLINGIRSGISGVVSAISDVVSSAVNKAKSFLDINSPSRVFRDQVGLMIMRGWALGMSKGEKQVLKVSDQLNNALLDKEQELNDKLAAMEQEERDKQAAEELADYQQKIKEKYDELEKAEISERQAILDEISELEADWNEKQLEAQRDAEKEKLQAQLDTLEDFKDEYQDALDEIQSSQDSMSDKLKDYGDLFTTVQNGTREFMELGDLEKDIEAINRYGEALENLKARGVSDSLLDEITSLSVDEATEYTEKLLAMTDDQYNEYMALWEQKQQAAQQVAAQFYSSEIEALGREFVDKIPEELGEVKNEMTNIGVQGVQGMISGMLSQTGALFSVARTIITGAMDAMRDEADIHSPSKKTANLVGVPLAQGVGVGFDKAYPNVMAKLKNAFAASMEQTSARIRTMADNPAAYGTRTQRIVQTINRNTTNTTRVVPDGRGIFTLVEEESRRRGKSMISGKGLVT